MQQWYQCPNCGAWVTFGTRFCGNCGTQLNWPTQQRTQPPPSYQQSQQQWGYGHGQGIEEPEEAIERLKEITSKNQKLAIAWSALSEACLSAGRFEEAKETAITAVDLNPQEALLHFNLSTIYYVALCNSKASSLDISQQQYRLIVRGLKTDPKLLSTPDELPEPVKGLTLQVLGCSYDYARQMAEKHCRKALKLSKDMELTRAAKDQLATLRLVDQM